MSNAPGSLPATYKEYTVLLPNGILSGPPTMDLRSLKEIAPHDGQIVFRVVTDWSVLGED